MAGRRLILQRRGCAQHVFSAASLSLTQRQRDRGDTCYAHAVGCQRKRFHHQCFLDRYGIFLRQAPRPTLLRCYDLAGRNGRFNGCWTMGNRGEDARPAGRHGFAD